MRIAGRLAVQADEAVDAMNRLLYSFNGCNVVVRHISERAFEADLPTELPSGVLVRLRLPGAGMMVARVVQSSPGKLVADFVNPVSETRIAKTLGFSRMQDALIPA